MSLLSQISKLKQRITARVVLDADKAREALVSTAGYSVFPRVNFFVVLVLWVPIGVFADFFAQRLGH